jgi:hypothetical protein
VIVGTTEISHIEQAVGTIKFEILLAYQMIEKRGIHETN